jgi:hypothetical protein
MEEDASVILETELLAPRINFRSLSEISGGFLQF